MKHAKMVGILLALCLLVINISASAQVGANTQDNVFTLAQYMPDTVGVYASVRADDAYIRLLDNLFGKFWDGYDDVLMLVNYPLPLGERWSLENIGQQFGLFPDGLSMGDLLAMFGDEIAIGIEHDNALRYGVMSLNDSEAFIQHLLNHGSVEAEPQGAYRIFTYGTAFTYVAADHAIGFVDTEGVVNIDYPAGAFDRLSDSEIFQATLAAAPSYRHDLFVYIGREPINAMLNTQVESFGSNLFRLAQLMPETITLSGIGMGDGTLALDVTMRPISPPANQMTLTDITPEFARYAPMDADFIIHGADIAATAAGITAQIPSYASVVEDIKARNGFDLAAFQAALQGQYTAFLSYDPIVFRNPLEGRPVSNAELLNGVDFGIVLQTRDTTAATEQFTAITTVWTQVGLPNVTLGTEDISGISTTSLDLNIPLGNEEFWTRRLLLVAQEDVLLFGTAEKIREILAGNGGYRAVPNYGLITANTLPSPTVLGVAGSDGTLLMAAVPLIYLQNRANISTDGTTPTAIPVPDYDTVLPLAIERLAALLPGATFSADYDMVGVYRLRLTLFVGD